MGLYDRDYYRDEERPGIRLGGDWSAVATLIAINVALFLANLFTADDWLTGHLLLQPDLFERPWNAWQLVTYGFVHDPRQIWHIAFNMLGLWFFGSEVEAIDGRREFYKLYVSLIILSGLFNVVVQTIAADAHPTLGASGGVVGVAVIFACHFPRRLIYVWGVLPVPAMILVVVYVVLEFLGTQNRESTVAHWAHLGGAAFGFLDYKTGWNLFRLWPRGWSMKPIRMRMFGPKLRVHREADEDEQPPPDDYLTTGRLQQRVDQLLEKISRSGEGSLTDEERQFLADASRRYQQQRRR